MSMGTGNISEPRGEFQSWEGTRRAGLGYTTIFDLFFPQAGRGNRSLINTIMLSLYGIALAGGILLMTARIVVLYLKSRRTGFIF